jgi:hypothetical protein
VADFSYDLATDRGKVRLLIPDSKVDSFVFLDNEIDGFLAMETGVKRAAALALETIASDQVLVLKVIKILDLTTDGAKTSDALLKRAEKLRGQAGDEEELAVGNGWDIAGMIVDDHTLEQAVYNDAMWGLY